MEFSRPKIREWGACPFSRVFFWPREWTWISCIAGRLFTIWATREAHIVCLCVCVCVWTWIYHLWDSMWFSVLPGLQWLTFLMLDKFWPLSLQIIFQALSLSSSSIPVICMLVLLMLSQRYQRLCSFLFILFPLLWSIAVVYTNLYSSSLICFSASFILLFFPASVFFISVIVLFISVL